MADEFTKAALYGIRTFNKKVKEKIGMMKLIELLNEYEKERIEKINSEGKLMVKLSFRPYTEESLTNKAYRSCWLEICSKYYGFIKWLVENDKIDREQFYDKARKIITDFDLRGEYEGACNEIIMLLSISDTPIDDLISYLK